MTILKCNLKNLTRATLDAMTLTTLLTDGGGQNRKSRFRQLPRALRNRLMMGRSMKPLARCRGLRVYSDTKPGDYPPPVLRPRRAGEIFADEVC